MSSYDFAGARLFVEQRLSAGGELRLEGAAANYLRNVLRLKVGDVILLFNGLDGEWRAVLSEEAKRHVGVRLEALARAQTEAGDLWYLFAPLKHARLDYMVQKAVEMGASRLMPVMTRRTQAARVNSERMRANAVEAAEQCGILTLPEVDEALPLSRVLADWPAERRLIFCDEDAECANPVEALKALPPGSLAMIIGPEGGFDESERKALLALPQAVRISLGPRILRADTAAVAALAVMQAALGDWR